MVTQRISDRRMIVCGAVIVLGCTCWLLASLAVGQETERSRRKAAPVPAAGPKEAKQDQELHVQIYRLKYADAAQLAEMVIAVYRDRPIKLTADKNANSIIVAAPPELQVQLAQLIERLDQTQERAADRELKVFRLKYADSQETAAVVSRIFGKDDARIAVDTRTNSILVETSPDTLRRIEALLSTLDVVPDKDAKKDAPGATLRVRVVWLANELPPDEGGKPADDLKEVVNELAKVGVEGLRQLGQAMVNTTPDGKFQIRCSPLLAGRPSDLEISGTLKMRQDTPILNVQLSASQTEPAAVVERVPGPPGRPTTKRLVELGTTIAAPQGHYVVLGVTPVGKMTSVFILQVTAGKQ